MDIPSQSMPGRQGHHVTPEDNPPDEDNRSVADVLQMQAGPAGCCVLNLRGGDCTCLGRARLREADGPDDDPDDEPETPDGEYTPLEGHWLASLVYALTLAALHARPTKPYLTPAELRTHAAAALDAEAVLLDVCVERDEAVWDQAVAVGPVDESKGGRP